MCRRFPSCTNRRVVGYFSIAAVLPSEELAGDGEHPHDSKHHPSHSESKDTVVAIGGDASTDADRTGGSESEGGGGFFSRLATSKFVKRINSVVLGNDEEEAKDKDKLEDVESVEQDEDEEEDIEKKHTPTRSLATRLKVITSFFQVRGGFTFR